MSVWATITSIPNGTRILNNGYDQCVALANHYHTMLGGSFVPVNSAYQWWTNSYNQVNAIYTRSSVPVAGAIFVSQGGIYDRTHGHIGIVTRVNPMGTFDTLEQNAGTWRYVGRYTRGMGSMLGFLIPKNNPANVPLQPNERKVGSNPAKRRSQPTSQSAEAGEALAAGVVGAFNGWIYGEQVNDGIANTNIWFRGALSGHWFWSGAFVDRSITGLSDLNPPAKPVVGPHQRQVKGEAVNVRTSPSTSSAIGSSLAANAIVAPEGWVTGQSIDGVAVWYKVQGGYTWAGAYTSASTASLTDLNPATPAPVDPPLAVDPTGPDAAPDPTDVGPMGVLKNIVGWNSLVGPTFGTTDMERPVPASVNIPTPNTITELVVKPQGGFYEGRPGAPNHMVLHWGGQPNLGYSASGQHSGIINTLLGPGVPTANFTTKDEFLVRMVDTRDTPATNGRYASNLWAITWEMCNDKTTTDKPSAKTHETTAWSMAREAERWGFAKLELDVNVFLHKQVSKSATSCPGSVDAAWIVDRANAIRDAFDDNLPVPEPDYSGLEVKIDKLTALVQWIVDLLKSIFNR